MPWCSGQRRLPAGRVLPARQVLGVRGFASRSSSWSCRVLCLLCCEIWAASMPGAVFLLLIWLPFGLGFGTAGEHSWGERALRRSGQLGREASSVLVRHSNKARTSLAFLVSYTARLELGKIKSRVSIRPLSTHGSPEPALRSSTTTCTSGRQQNARPARDWLCRGAAHKRHRSGTGRDDRRPGKPSARGQRHLPADEELR